MNPKCGEQISMGPKKILIRLAIKPNTSFPNGSMSEMGLIWDGCVLGLPGLGIKYIQESFHDCGMIGGLQLHQTCNCRYNAVATWIGALFQMMAGKNGCATDLCGFRPAMARVNASKVKGIPGALSEYVGNRSGPAHISCTNATVKEWARY